MTPTTPPGARDLPVLGQPRERADARRNRERLLTAAARLFADRGVAAVTADEIVAAAGVGKGTLFRRFGDKRGLALALLDAAERDLQAAILRGPPPLGPGAAAGARLAAFVDAYVAHLAAHLDLVTLSETAAPGARLRSGAHALWRRHLELLYAAAGAGDPGLRADVLLAALAADQVGAWLAAGHDPARLAARLGRAAAALAGP